MTTYKLIDKEILGQLIAQLKALQGAISPLVEFLSKTEGTITLDSIPALPLPPNNNAPNKVRIGKGGVKLADLIFNSIKDGEFSAKMALKVISDKTDWNPPRALDSIRVALDKDARFERVGLNYKKR